MRVCPQQPQRFGAAGAAGRPRGVARRSGSERSQPPQSLRRQRKAAGRSCRCSQDWRHVQAQSSRSASAQRVPKVEHEASPDGAAVNACRPLCSRFGGCGRRQQQLSWFQDWRNVCTLAAAAAFRRGGSGGQSTTRIRMARYQQIPWEPFRRWTGSWGGNRGPMIEADTHPVRMDPLGTTLRRRRPASPGGHRIKAEHSWSSGRLRQARCGVVQAAQPANLKWASADPRNVKLGKAYRHRRLRTTDGFGRRPDPSATWTDCSIGFKRMSHAWSWC